MERATRAFTAAATVAALVIGLPSGAQADPGDGVRVAGWVFHPSIEGDVAYQTNVYLLDRTGLSPHSDDWITRLVPQISGEHSGGRARLRFFGLYDWRQYAFNPGLDAHNDFAVGVTTSFDEERDLGIIAEDQYRIQSRPNELDLYGQYRRNANVARVSTVYRPGTALEVRPSVFYDYDRFSNSRLTIAERHTTGVVVDARWAFLSRTVLAITGEGGRVQYSQSPILPTVPSERVNSTSTWWHGEMGVVGQLSPKVNMALKGGYGQALYQRNESLSDSRGITATAKLDWLPRQNAAASLGYERAFQDVFFTNFDVVDRAFARYRHVLPRELTAEMAAVAEWQQYSRPFQRRDFVFRLEPGVKRNLATWADVSFAYRFERRYSRVEALGGPASIDAPSGYTSHAFLVIGNLKW